jgi:hypothetical protein
VLRVRRRVPWPSAVGVAGFPLPIDEETERGVAPPGESSIIIRPCRRFEPALISVTDVSWGAEGATNAKGASESVPAW